MPDDPRVSPASARERPPAQDPLATKRVLKLSEAHPFLGCWIRCALVALLLAGPAGCTRARYRMRADADAYGIVREKTAHRPWMPPPGYNVVPDPRSRLFDPTPIDDPLLPIPAPKLYHYELPELPPRDPERFTPRAVRRLPPVQRGPAADRPPGPGPVRPSPSSAPQAAQPEPAAPPPYPGRQQSFQQPAAPPDLVAAPGDPQRAPPTARPAAADRRAADAREQEKEEEEEEVRLVPIPASAWQRIPSSCLKRMLEFDSVRGEFGRTFQRAPTKAEIDQARRLTLEDIIDLASLNSREYQTQKETLYRAALRLSLERFDFDLKFATTNNSTAANFDHARDRGATVNTLRVPTNFQVDKVLATGGDLLARFANNVVLTFNGPQGFAADIGSELFLELSQSLFQRDIRFEDLTQAERDVVYAARDFTRFRKQLFVQLASDYYSLIRTYRQVEIDTQNYFTLVRAFEQGEVEYRAGFLPRFQLDQIEQDVFGGRSRLITTCDNLERALDNLKIRIGLPTELPINLDLTELQQITLRDQSAVAGELIRRVRRRLSRERQQEAPNRAVLLSSAIVLIERLLDALQLQQRRGQPPRRAAALEDLRAQMRVDEARLQTEQVRQELEKEERAESRTLTIVFQRRVDLIDQLLELIARQIQLARRRAVPAEGRARIRRQLADLRRRLAKIRARLARIIEEARVQELKRLDADAAQLQKAAENLVQAADQLTGRPEQQLTPDQQLRQTLQQVDFLLRESQHILQTIQSGLVPIRIDPDEAMLTALVERFDLMNERGRLADDWRRIKLAADDLRSILNLNASQSIRTPADRNRPFAFTFQESQTRLGATFDAPLNRRAQRNSFRQSLIDYQAARRRRMQLEDNIKLAVRNDLRDLALKKEQYVIDVASAALAFERVVSTRLELRLGVQGVEARDFLQAQNAYTSALSSVAGRHIDYIVDRTQLFFDLELLTVDENGFWPQLYDEQYAPTPRFQLPDHALPAYGTLPRRVRHSRRIRRMLHVPPGTAILRTEPGPAAPERLPPPPTP